MIKTSIGPDRQNHTKLYPINPGMVEYLKISPRTTGFRDNIVARLVEG